MPEIFEVQTKKSRRPVPFSFVLDNLENGDPITKSMFGCTAIYVGDKIVLVLREKNDHQEDNGIWVATTPEHHASLKTDFPSLRDIRLFGDGPTGWQNLPADTEDFEESANRICELILEGDARIGKIPKPKTSKKKRPKPKPRKKQA